MTINVNNQPHSVSESITLTEVVAQLNIISAGIAIAINNEIISKDRWNATNLKEQDQVIIIKATQGG
ncbi:sulfur carrier protein ThiS [Aquimarina sp. 2201CG1-2-11]|uniref:sulfur carrier protein ThiS n=1 Tax=Aquimarina discodermiae TaxID=3231043 RepID=UPI003462818E